VGFFALCLLTVSIVFGQSDKQAKPDTLSPAALGEEKYQDMKSKGLLPQPEQAKAPAQLSPENVISPAAMKRSKGLLIPLDDTFRRLPITSEAALSPDAEEQSLGYEVRLRSRAFTPEVDVQSLLSVIAAEEIRPQDLLSGRIHAVIQFYEIPTETEKTSLETAGILLHAYLPNYSYTASLDLGITAQQLAGLGVRSLFELQRNDKLSESIIDDEIGVWARPEPGKVDIIVRYYPDVPNEAAETAVQSRGAEILFSSDYFHRVTIRIDESRLPELADLEWVSWIEPVPPPPIEGNDGSRASIRVDELQAAPYSLTGTGIRMGVWDGGRIFAHQGFGTRLTIIDNVAVSDHATHVAGTMAGDGTGSTDNSLRGMATAADIYSWDFNGDTPTEMANGITNQQIVVSQNSWGYLMHNGNCNLFGDYTSESRDFDQLVRDRDLLIAFIVHNYRDDGICGITIPDGYNSITPHGGAKNIIAVGAVTKGDAMTDLSGWGPTDDGRLKPDVVAVGHHVASTLSDDGYSDPIWNGTSMACSAVSGVAALLMERYRQLNSNNDPLPELTKAVLLNTAVDLGRPGPDYCYGYGKVDALAAASVIDRAGYIVDAISQGNTRNHTVPVHGVDGIKVLLSYSDREAAASADPALVNDLNLTLIAPDGTEHLPLTLDPANPGNDAAPAVNDRDNVEQVVVDNPASGNWTIRVTAPTVPFGPQDYVVTWDWDHRYSAAPFTNGTPPEYRNDDGSTDLMPLSFPFCFYGAEYNQVYINNNGNLSFEGPYWQYTPTGFPIADYAMIASFWADVDTRNGGSGIVYYRSEPHRLTVIWDRVGYYSHHVDKLNTFEVIITDGNDPLIGIGNNVCFSYGDMQWTTGDITGSGGFGGAPATVGANRGNGIDYALVGRFDHEGVDYDGPGGNPDGVSYLDGRAFYYDVCQGAGTISGTKFNDANGNGVRDAGEAGLPGWTITLNPGGLATLTDGNGEYFFSFLDPNIYTVSEVLKPNWEQTYPAAPGNHVVDLSLGQTVTGIDFGNRALADIQDLSVDIAGGRARPGFQKFYGITYENKGTLPVAGTVILSLPSEVSYLESSAGGVYVAATHSVTWDVGSLAPGFIGWLWSKVQIPNTIPIGTVLTSSAQIDPTAGDANPADNSDSEWQVVQGSFDPNDKRVTPEGDILATDTLAYQINFQNVGTDTAFNIILRDTLDMNLDIVTLQNGASSHPSVFQVVGRELSWTFANINLPDSIVNEPGSHGFVTFKALPMPGVPIGTELENRALIYFDFNPPVFTNTVRNRIVELPPILAIELDIKPQSCPNPFNTKAKGVLPAAILGTEDFDVSTVDPATVLLEGVAPLRDSLEDVSRPVDPREDVCDCTADTGDGYMDMTLKFDRQEILAALGSVSDRDTIVLTLTGVTYDGMPIEGQDCVVIIKKGLSKPSGETPNAFSLRNNYPNPFNPVTQISYTLPRDGHVKLEIYNLLGQKVAIVVDEYQQAGQKTINWEAKDLSSGIYFYKLSAGDFTATKKMVLTK